jgi:predicted dehydrogenase
LRIRAICDLNAEILERHRAAYHPDYVTHDYREVLRDDRIDFVVIGTRHDVRLPLIKAAAEAGKPMWVEKPMSSSNAESREILDIIRGTGVILQVGFNRRFAPGIQDLKRVIQRFPRLQMIFIRAIEERKLWPDWPFTPEHGGTLGSEACHFMDLATFLVGVEPVRIRARGDAMYALAISMDFANGCVVEIFCGVHGSAGYPKEYIEAFGGECTAVLRSFVELNVCGVAGEIDRSYPLEFDPTPEAFRELPAFEALYRKNRYWRDHIPMEDFEARHYYRSQPQVNKGRYEALDAFAKAVREKWPATACNELDGARATAMVLAAADSLKKDRPVDFCLEEALGK